jgi:hypothetical protein
MPEKVTYALRINAKAADGALLEMTGRRGSRSTRVGVEAGSGAEKGGRRKRVAREIDR